MRKEHRWIDQARAELRTMDAGTKVLVAIEGFSEPGRDCFTGELLMPPADCGTLKCICEDGFHGVDSHGTTSVGRVRRLRGIPRGVALAAIAASMRHDGVEDPDRDAAAFLDEVADIEEGRLVRREERILLPFPMAARITAPHSIQYHLDDAP